MKQNRTTAAAIALCGLMAALAVILMAFGGIVPVATYCTPMLAGLLMIPILEECGTRLSLVWYVAVAVLSSLLSPDKEAAALYVFLGYYPILKLALDRIHCAALRIAAKLTVFNIAVAAMYGLLLAVLKMESLASEFRGMGSLLLIAMQILGNVTFLLFDVLLDRMQRIYRLRLRRHLRFFGLK